MMQPLSAFEALSGPPENLQPHQELVLQFLSNRKNIDCDICLWNNPYEGEFYMCRGTFQSDFSFFLLNIYQQFWKIEQVHTSSRATLFVRFVLVDRYDSDQWPGQASKIKCYDYNFYSLKETKEVQYIVWDIMPLCDLTDDPSIHTLIKADDLWWIMGGPAYACLYTVYIHHHSHPSVQ